MSLRLLYLLECHILKDMDTKVRVDGYPLRGGRSREGIARDHAFT